MLLKKQLIFLVPAIILFAALFSGCNTVNEVREGPNRGDLYYWGNFELYIFEYLTGNAYDQIQDMERDRQRIESSNRHVPPGFYAHLGLLYNELGHHAMAIYFFEREKALFPEAETFINLLLSNRYGM